MRISNKTNKNNNMTTNNKVKKETSERKNKQWLRSPDQRKRTKLLTVNMVQLPDGRFHILGGGASATIKKNQHSVGVYPIDVRDLATEMRMNGVTSF